MEKYKTINLERLERKEYFDYFQSIGTIIQITKKLILRI
jgi:chloramphenicol O-acetyltransferase